MLKCGHKFHSNCFDEWKTTKISQLEDISCPTCRTIILKNKTNNNIDNDIVNILRRLFPFNDQIMSQLEYAFRNNFNISNI